MESAEIHSMSMEFFTWPWMEEFFKEETDRFKYKHVAGSLSFLPYGACVVHFQHWVYENPDVSSLERKEKWLELESLYLPNRDYDDLEFVSEGVKIFIKRSKTDQSGEGMIKALPYFKNNEFCPVRFLRKWLEISKIKSGLIFNISDKSIVLLIKKYTSAAGLDSKKYSGHSLRSGFATVSAEFGANERSIMEMTGHKTTQMVRRYIKEANLFKNNALNKINI